MTTALKLRRGTTSQHSTFTGAAGEVTVDTTKNTVVVHDGATAGGIPLAREANVVTSATAVGGTGISVSAVTTVGSATHTISLANTAVTAGSYTNAAITVDAQGRLTAASSGTAPVTSVTGTAPIVSSGGATPAISIPAATTSVSGHLTSTDWNTFNNKQAALVSGTNIKTVNGTSLVGAGDVGVGVTSVVAGSYLTGGTISTTGTLAVDATSANTASKVVARDASGNFSAGTITAGLIGNATSANTATNQSGGTVSATTGTFSGAVSFNGGINSSPVIKKQNTTGEGGELQLEKSDTSTLGGNLIIDLVGNSLRFFEAGGTARGVYIDISAQSAGAGGVVLTNTNYNSYAPTLTGTGASGNWAINVTGSAAKWTTARTESLTGDITGSTTVDGSANYSIATTLATVNSNVGSFGSSTAIPVVTVNAKGLVTAVSTATVAGGQYFGTAATKAISYNADTISENITITAGNNGLSAGPITISTGYTVTVNGNWVIV